jgi:hypothetical protein
MIQVAAFEVVCGFSFLGYEAGVAGVVGGRAGVARTAQ